MPSSYRACITNDARLRAPWPRPEGYDEAQFELLIRLAQALPNTTQLGSLVGIYPYFGYPATAERPMKYGALGGRGKGAALQHVNPPPHTPPPSPQTCARAAS